MKIYITSCLMLCFFVVSGQHKVNVPKQMGLAARQYSMMIDATSDSTIFPQSVNPDGSVRQMKAEWWGSGFFPGALWYLWEYTHDPQFKDAARKWTSGLANEQYDTSTHDLGFILYCSYGNGFRLTGDPSYRSVLLRGASSLASRFDPKVGLIKSWDNFKGYHYPVIIDNMMNLEYLLWAAKASGDKRLYQIAVSHADNTLKNHFRADQSSYHVVLYDSVGGVLAKKTAQGYSDNSVWSRGQSWGLYGYTVLYRETKDQKYLQHAMAIARFLINNPKLPKDKIPFWDLNDPGIPNVSRDASAAAVTASALLELARFVDQQKSKAYFSFAEDVLVSLSSPEYFATTGNHHFLLKHSTGNLPAKKEIDVPLIYADYYYLEALLRYDRFK